MRDYKQVDYDNGGVHINSCIPNHAFYLAAMEIGGHTAEKAGLIWYVTLRDKLRARSDFQDAANLTYVTAGERFGTGSLEQQAVRNGWAGVGIEPDVPEPPPDERTEEPTPRRSGCLTAPLAALFRSVRP